MAEETGSEVYALLEEAKRYGIGLLFEPDLDEDGNEAGWTINYVIHGWPAVQGQTADFPGDRLASAHDLETAVGTAATRGRSPAFATPSAPNEAMTRSVAPASDERPTLELR